MWKISESYCKYYRKLTFSIFKIDYITVYIFLCYSAPTSERGQNRNSGAIASFPHAGLDPALYSTATNNRNILKTESGIQFSIDL